MNKKILWITETAVLLALLIVLQWVTKPLGQFVTGSCVNAVLAVAALMVGLSSGLTVALVSPVCAYLLGIAPNMVAVPAIMAGNAVFILALALLCGKALWRKIAAWLVAAAAKFAVLYTLVVVLICGPLSGSLLEAGLMKKPMIAVMTASFSWPQLVTALIGGALALILVPVLKKALRKN
jgi:hypothetical protein